MSASAKPETGRLASVEALRGLAAASVAWYHLTDTYGANIVRESGSFGWLGVDAFFVISGFVIPYSLASGGYTTKEFGRFLARRVIRLEPPYIVSIVLVIALNAASTWAPGFAGKPVNYSPAQVASNLFYLVPLTRYEWIQPVYWSLAYEFVFYIATGLLFAVLWRRSLILLALATAAAVGVKFLLAGSLDGRIPLFLIGIGAARRQLGRDTLITFLLMLAASIAAMVAMGFVLNALTGAATALTILYVRIPPWPPLTRLGRISYSLYLIHVPVGGRLVNLGKRFGTGVGYELALSAAAFGVCLLFAWVFHTLIEARAQRWSRSIRLAGATRAAVAVAG